MSSRKESEGKSRQGSGRELAQHLPRQSARLDPDRAAFVREAAPVHPDAMHAPRIGAQPRRIAGQIEQPLFGADPHRVRIEQEQIRSEEHTSELQSLMRISYAVFCLKKKKEVIRIK